MTYHSIDGAVRPNLDYVLLEQLVNVVEDGLHACDIFFIQYAKWLHIVAKHLEVGWGHNKLKHVINIATFGEIFERPGFQTTISIGMPEMQLERDLAEEDKQPEVSPPS